MSKYSFYLLLLAIFMSCNQTDQHTPAKAANLPGFDITAIPGSPDFQHAEKKDPQTGQLLESGELYQGKLSGTWVKYNQSKQYVESISSYVDGKRNGIYLEFNELGRIKRNAHYLNDLLHGADVVYSRNTRKEKEATYKNGKLDGTYREFDLKENLTKEIGYKDGQLHGSYRYFNDEGKLTVEYTYENGQKISGGAVTN